MYGDAEESFGLCVWVSVVYSHINRVLTICFATQHKLVPMHAQKRIDNNNNEKTQNNHEPNRRMDGEPRVYT